MKNIDIDSLSLSTDISIDIKEELKEDLISKNLDVCFVYKSIFKNTKYLRFVIEKILVELGVEKAWIGRFVLIVDELNNNAIEYWSKKTDQNMVRFKSSYNEKTKNLEINIEVEDMWTWKGHKRAADMMNIEKQRINKWFEKYDSIRWRGLFLIIYKLVDQLYFIDSEKWWLIVWVKKNVTLKENSN